MALSDVLALAMGSWPNGGHRRTSRWCSGVALGAWLARRNEKQATTERLLVEAINDLIDAGRQGGHGVPNAEAQYGSALARVALQGSPEVVQAFRHHQEEATTVTPEGRRRFIAAIQQARKELGHKPLDERDLEVLLFGPPSQRAVASPRLSRSRLLVAFAWRPSLPFWRIASPLVETKRTAGMTCASSTC